MNNLARMVFVGLSIIALAVGWMDFGAVEAQTSEPSITAIELSGVPKLIDCKQPCPGFSRGSRLKLTINQPGFAAAYLKPSGDRYYLAEGRLVWEGSQKAGCVRLWPAGRQPNGQVYELWVVTSKTEIRETRDSEGLEQLPLG